jgi:hypothetical protein
MGFSTIRLVLVASAALLAVLTPAADATADVAVAPVPAAPAKVVGQTKTSLAECLTLPADKTITMNGPPSDKAASVGAWYADEGCPDFSVDVVITSDAKKVDASAYSPDQLFIEADRPNMNKEECEKYLEKFVVYKKGSDGKFDRIGGGMKEGKWLLSPTLPKKCKPAVRPGWDPLPGHYKAPAQGSVTYRVLISGRLGFTGAARPVDVTVQHAPKP